MLERKKHALNELWNNLQDLEDNEIRRKQPAEFDKSQVCQKSLCFHQWKMLTSWIKIRALCGILPCKNSDIALYEQYDMSKMPNVIVKWKCWSVCMQPADPPSPTPHSAVFSQIERSFLGPALSNVFKFRFVVRMQHIVRMSLDLTVLDIY